MQKTWSQVNGWDVLSTRGILSANPRNQIGYSTEKGRVNNALKNLPLLKDRIRHGITQHGRVNLPK